MASTVLPNGIIVPEKFSRDWYADLYHNWQELDNLLGGGTPKDGTLTIQKNGDTVGTFSANQSTDETVNIEVPTATSELTNDSGFITGVSWNDVSDKPSFATVATSGSYTDLSDKPTIPTVNDSTLTIQQNGVTVDTFTANSSTDKTVNIQCVDLSSNQTVGGNKEFIGTTTAHDLVPSATDTYNFGSSTAQWNNAYIKSLTINGTQFLPSDYMTLNTIQTVTSTKNYTGYQDINAYRLRIKSPIQEKGVIPTSNRWNGFLFCDKNNETMFSIEQGMLPNGAILTNFSARANDTDTTFTTFLQYINNSDLTINAVNVIDLMPFGNGTRKLGNTNAKWKSFNGLNPGALSLPGASVNVDTTNWVLDGSDVNSFTPTSDGWLGIQVTDTVYDQMHYVFVGRNDSASYHSQNVLSPINALWDGEYHGCVFIPVVKNFNYDIRCICSTIVATFYPCQGNV